MVYRRRFVAFGVGTPKSGTKSLARIFEQNFRSAHEPRPQHLEAALLAHSRGELATSEMRKWLKQRDRELWLEMEASHPLHMVIETLVEEIPESLYVLTVRDPYTWVESEINQHMKRMNEFGWQQLKELRYRPGSYEYQAQDAELQRRGLYPLASYLDYWTRHHERVVGAVPRERLLVVPTSDISTSLDDLARFVGVPPGSLDAAASHSHARSKTHFDFWSAVDRRYLEAQVLQRCGDIMRRLLPKVGSIGDVLSEG